MGNRTTVYEVVMVGVVRVSGPQIQVNAQPGNSGVDTSTNFQGDATSLLFLNGQGAVVFEDFFSALDQDIQARFLSATDGRPTGVQFAPPGLGFLGSFDQDPAAAVLANVNDPSIAQNRGLVVWAEQVAANNFDIVGRLITANGDTLNAARFVLAGGVANQQSPDVAALPNGKSVVSWQRTDLGIIEAQILNVDGQTIAVPSFRVDSQGSSSAPSVAGLTNNNFVIAWVGADVNGAGIHAQVFNGQTGVKIGNELGTNTNPLNISTTLDQNQVDIAALSNGNFAIAWTDASTRSDANGATDSSSTAIKVRVFDSNGSPATGEILVNTAKDGAQNQPSITAGLNGGFVVGWTDASGLPDSAGRLDASGTSIKAQAFSADGSKLGGELLVNSVTAGNQFNVHLTTGANGAILATFDDQSGQVDVGGQTADPSGGGVQAVRLAFEPAPPPVIAEEVFRFFNTRTGGHFFTVSEHERNEVQATNQAYRFESVGFGAFETASVSGLEEVYRFFNTSTGGHFFTTSEIERDTVLATNRDYRFEGTKFYEFQTDQGNLTDPVFRFFNTRTGGHFFTKNQGERDNVIATNTDYRYEGIAFFAPDAGTGFLI